MTVVAASSALVKRYADEAGADLVRAVDDELLEDGELCSRTVRTAELRS